MERHFLGKAIFPFIALVLIQCKSEPSYNSVVQKAIESEEQSQQMEEPSSFVQADELLPNTMKEDEIIVDEVQNENLSVIEPLSETDRAVVSKKKSKAKIVFD